MKVLGDSFIIKFKILTKNKSNTYKDNIPHSHEFISHTKTKQIKFSQQYIDTNHEREIFSYVDT